MESYELWLRNRGLTPNTTSFYMRILRAVYNRAVENDMTENQSPFRHVYTGIEKTVKRALPLRTVRKIKELDLSQSPLLDFARNMFMMSFYLRGMSFIDMAFLKNLAADTKRLTAEKKAYKAQTAEARQEAETAMRERDEAKAERDAQRKEAVSNIANIFTGSKAKRLEAEVARKDNEIRELKDRAEAREQDFRREMSNLSDNLRRQKESEASTIRIHEYMKNDLNTFFPDVLPLLEAARECREVGLSDAVTRVLLDQKPRCFNQGATIHSETYRQDFDVSDAEVQIKRSPTDNKFHLHINGTRVFQWLKEQWQRLKQTFSRGIRR